MLRSMNDWTGLRGVEGVDDSRASEIVVVDPADIIDETKDLMDAFAEHSMLSLLLLWIDPESRLEGLEGRLVIGLCIAKVENVRRLGPILGLKPRDGKPDTISSVALASQYHFF